MSTMTRITPMTAFSILHRIEFAATGFKVIYIVEAKIFQYPPSDRVRCNPKSNRRIALLALTFSILHRIEFAATSLEALYAVEQADFQYPPSDRVRCNRMIVDASRGVVNLSVSSIGSSSLQLLRQQKKALEVLAFSILHRIEFAATNQSRETM